MTLSAFHGKAVSIIEAFLASFFITWLWTVHLFIIYKHLPLSFDAIHSFDGLSAPGVAGVLAGTVILCGLLLLAGWENRRERLYISVLTAALMVGFTALNRSFCLLSFPLTAFWLIFIIKDITVRFPGIHIIEAFFQKYASFLPYILFFASFCLMFFSSYHRFAAFRSGSKDMGLFTQTIWLLSQGISPENTIMGRNAFADHAELIDFAIIPFMWLWKSPGSLLLFQSLIVCSAIFPLFFLARKKLGTVSPAVLITLMFPLLYGIQCAVMYDFNPETVAAGFVPWLFYLAEKRKWWLVFIPLLLIGFCKENLFLFTACFGLFCVFYYKTWFGLFFTLLSSGLFLGELAWFFPSFSTAGFRHFKDKGFGILGTGFADILASIITHPTKTLALLVTPEKKAVFLLYPFATLGFISLLFPWILLLVAPIIGSRYLSTFPNSWYGYFYGTVEETLLLIALVFSAAHFRQHHNPVMRKLADSLIPMAAMTLFLFVVFAPLVQPDLVTFGKNYPSEQQQSVYHRMLSLIPEDASVTAQNHFVPHLSIRKNIFIFQGVSPRRADYIAIDTEASTWPNTASQYQRAVQTIENDKNYTKIFSDGSVSLFKVDY